MPMPMKKLQNLKLIVDRYKYVKPTVMCYHRDNPEIFLLFNFTCFGSVQNNPLVTEQLRTLVEPYGDFTGYRLTPEHVIPTDLVPTDQRVVYQSVTFEIFQTPQYQIWMPIKHEADVKVS